MNCVQYKRTNITVNVTSIGLFQELRDEKGTQATISVTTLGSLIPF